MHESGCVGQDRVNRDGGGDSGGEQVQGDVVYCGLW